MLRFASLMRSAMSRRNPITLISVVAGPASCASRLAADGFDKARSRSARTMRPPGPDPATVARSMPASRARRRSAGEAMTRPARTVVGAAAVWARGAVLAGVLAILVGVLAGVLVVPAFAFWALAVGALAAGAAPA